MMDRCTCILFLAALSNVLSTPNFTTSNIEYTQNTFEAQTDTMTQEPLFTGRDAFTQRTSITETVTLLFDKRLDNSITDSLLQSTSPHGFSSYPDSSSSNFVNISTDTNMLVTAANNGFSEQGGTTNQNKVDLAPEVLCSNNWSRFKDFCFYLIINGTGKTFADYETDCRRLDSQLSSIHSTEEYNHVVRYVEDIIRSSKFFFTNNGSRDSIWFGLYYESAGWLNIDRSAVDYLENLSVKGNSGHCASIRPGNNDYRLDPCNSRKNGALCKSKAVRIFSDDERVEIYSPNYPANYDGENTEKYLLQAPKGYRVLLTFEKFNLDGVYPDCSFDSLTVYDGNSAWANFLYKLCGGTLPEPIRSSTNEMYLKFVSDGYDNNQGFRATGTFLAVDIYSTDSPNLSTVSGTTSTHIFRSGLITGICVLVVILVALMTIVILLARRRLFSRVKEKYFLSRRHGVVNTLDAISSQLSIKNDPQECVLQRNEIPLKGIKEYPSSSLSMTSCIGKGAFSFVYKAKALGVLATDDVTTVAVKILKGNVTEREKQDFLYELQLLNKLKHPNVVSLYGFFRCDDTSLGLIMEYLKNGNLLQFLRSFSEQKSRLSVMGIKEDGTKITSKQLMRFGLDIAYGMEYLASKNLVHRDVAARNILLGDDFECKVSDLGLARILKYSNEYEMRSKSRVPVRWMSPESVLRNKYSTASDVWSFGVVLWEIATLGSHPYPGLGCTQIIDDIKMGKRLPQPAHCRDEIYNLMMACWQYHPSKRPEFSDLKQTLDQLLETEMDYFLLEKFKEDEYVYISEDDPPVNEIFDENEWQTPVIIQSSIKVHSLQIETETV